MQVCSFRCVIIRHTSNMNPRSHLFLDSSLSESWGQQSKQSRAFPANMWRYRGIPKLAELWLGSVLGPPPAKVSKKHPRCSDLLNWLFLRSSGSPKHPKSIFTWSLIIPRHPSQEAYFCFLYPYSSGHLQLISIDEFRNVHKQFSFSNSHPCCLALGCKPPLLKLEVTAQWSHKYHIICKMQNFNSEATHWKPSATAWKALCQSPSTC